MDEKLRGVNDATTFICREIGDHVHYPPARVTRSSRPHHTQSSIFYTGLESTSGITRKPHYGKCRKNHATGVGTTAYDGCGEFVSATAEEDSMNCAACGCHRSFHQEESVANTIPIYHSESRIGSTNKEKEVTEAVLKLLKRSSYQLRQILRSPYENVEENEPYREDLISKDHSGGGGGDGGGDVVEGKKVKRLKTKFSTEQTERMRNYAEKLQWKIIPENRDEVEQFCSEIGVKLQKFRVWMNNHKDKS